MPPPACPVGAGTSRQAVSRCFGTATPAPRVHTTSRPHRPPRGGLAGAPERERRPGGLAFPEDAGPSAWCRQGSSSSAGAGSGHPSDHALATSPFARLVPCGLALEQAGYFSWVVVLPAEHESSVVKNLFRVFENIQTKEEDTCTLAAASLAQSC
jgi:hypothetical protein